MTNFQGVQILYCDNHLLVAVKPPNMPAQADSSGSMDMLTLMRRFVKETFGKPGEVYLGLVHRLDRPVGGLMVFARTSKAAARLSEQLREREAGRAYLAIVHGEASEEARLVGEIARADGKPQEAILTYRRIAAREGLSLLCVKLETGRKHQIRIQLAEAGLPIWGDNRHGNGKPGEQIALWAVCLAFLHPTKREQMAFSSAPPEKHPWTLFLDQIKPILQNDGGMT